MQLGLIGKIFLKNGLILRSLSPTINERDSRKAALEIITLISELSKSRGVTRPEMVQHTHDEVWDATSTFAAQTAERRLRPKMRDMATNIV